MKLKEEKHTVTFFETLGGTYRREGDYLLPNIEIPEIPQLGFWGQRRHKYLLEHQPVPTLHGGFCLYNGDFTAALICLILVPELEKFFRTKEERKLAKTK